jgi:DNA phosphorothioation-dependent restriction protein DptH
MPNMLNQFYEYMSDKLINYLERESFKGGERFYLQFDNEKQVATFYDVLRKSRSTIDFEFTHKQGSKYSTFAIQLPEKIDVVVAATSGNVTPDFLVTLRNQVGEQKKQWENTALLSICHETLDSIRGGSSDLQKEGMPFNIKSILKNLKEEIDNSSLNNAEKEVLNFHLKKKLDETFVQSSLWDYEEILGFLSQGEIKKEDYSHLNLFYDKNLDQYTPKQMNIRLEENFNLYEKVQHIHEYESLDNQLEKLFDDKGIQALKKDSWQETDYQSVKDSADNAKVEKQIEYFESTKKVSEEGLIFWEKSSKETVAGRRNRHLLVFNPDKEKNINLKFEFSEFLKKEFVHKKSENVCMPSGKKLLVTLNHKADSSSFHQVVYTHKNQSKSKYVFNIAIVECESNIFKTVQTAYEINNKLKSIVINKKADQIILGNPNHEIEEVFVNEENPIFNLVERAIEISPSSTAWDDDTLSFSFQVNNSIIPIMVKEEISRITPINGNRVWKLKREQENSFIYDAVTNKLKQATREYSVREDFKRFLLDEQELINQDMYCSIREVKGLSRLQIKIDPVVEDAYINLLNYYKSHCTLPSLAFMDKELRELSITFVNTIIEHVKNIKENVILPNQTKNLFKLGTIIEEDRILLTPLHPLNVAYQLEINERLKSEKIDSHILDRLNPNNLLPYIYGEEKELFRPVTQNDAPEWLIYEPMQKVAIGESNTFLSNVVEEKLNQFIEHFQYLFINKSKSPIKINVINISNDIEVVKGLIKFIKKQIEKVGPKSIIPIEVALYDRNTISAFEKFSGLDNVEEFEEVFEISLSTKKLDRADVLRLIRENILYYKPLKNGTEYGYSHISFYKMLSSDLPAKNTIEEINTGLSMGGLMSSLSFLETKDDYRTGFGLKHGNNLSNKLVSVSKCLNELASNLDSGGTNPYRKNETIVTRTANYDEDILNQLYSSSFWVTFIEPNVDLNFFQNASRNLLVIHYSDQYSSSTQYDAITVTDKSQQYKMIIENYLASKEIVADTSKIETAIRSFNSLNGEWLLRIIGSKGQFSREKLSIISAIKYILSTIDHENILWVPVSLEEVLRIAGAVRLTKSEGVFSAKNLKAKGVHSDDLLLVGIESRQDDIFIHYYPVEVKIGYNLDSTISKAKDQILKTHNLFNTQLAKYNDEGEALFKNDFFRNFFIQLTLANVDKLIENKIWPEKKYKNINILREKLLNDDYELGKHLKPFIGKGAVLSFKKDQSWRAVKVDGEILIVDLTEEDGYTGVITEIEELKTKITNGVLDIKPENLLANRYRFSIENTSELSISFSNNENSKMKKEDFLKKEFEVDQGFKTPPLPKSDEKIPQTNDKSVHSDLSNIRVLLGTIEGSNKEVFWEYGNPGLANRHLLISGKSGQGKSYFIQCLLLELAHNGISNIIFDYTDGFKNSKLEHEFKEQLGDNLEQFLVARDKFPINPLKRNKKELDEGIYIDEDNTDIAERIKGVFSSVYKDLGIQQQNAIYEAVLRGLGKYGDSMNLELLISELEEDNSGPARTARSQIKPLIDKNPFNTNAEYDWSKILSQKGKVFIIQLTSYNRDVQMMITEFILWDLWNHQVNYGDKNRPLPVILDEAQNLDHRESSPSAKILTEGRKFGWSGWYATQSIRGQFTIDEVSRLQNSSQKVYFMPPENEITSIAANLAQDPAARKEWERKLSTLEKGQCVVSGPMLQNDGSLKQSVPVVIKISSLNERIK